jgi:plasmid stabilization system protein ParE
MPYTVRFTRRALADVDAATAYRARRSADIATRWRAGLLARLAALEQSPNLCPLADEADDLGLELRELLFGRRRNIHRILFTVEGQSVIIHRVRLAAQDRLTPDDI